MFANSGIWLLSSSVSLTCGLVTLSFSSLPTPPLLPLISSTMQPPPLSLPSFPIVHFSPFGLHCPAQSSVEEPTLLEAHLTSLCLSRICTRDCKTKTSYAHDCECEREIFAKLLYHFVFPSRLLSSLSNVEMMCLDMDVRLVSGLELVNTEA